MAFKFDFGSPVEDNLHRILAEQIDKALHQLTVVLPKDPAVAIYDARKRLKKSRSMLRLVRQGLEETAYQQEKTRLRDMGRQLAPARDAAAYGETLAKLVNDYATVLDVNAFAGLEQSLADYHRLKLVQVLEDGDTIPGLVSALKQLRDRIPTLTLIETDWAAISPNLKHLYRQGRKRMAIADESADACSGDLTASSHHFHEWRKRVKDLWYDLRLLRPLWPEMFKPWESEAHRLSSLLGDDHDIAELRQFLLSEPAPIEWDVAGLKLLLPLLLHRQGQLRQQTHSLGLRLYAESPKRYAKRIGAYWQATVDI